MMQVLWYAIHTYSGFEKTVGEQIRLLHSSLIEDVLIPTESIVSMKSGRKNVSERKFFPGYVLVKMVLDNDLWGEITRFPKVSKFLGGRMPSPIPERQIQKILDQMEEGVMTVSINERYDVGEVILVNDGPFKGFNGIVEEVDSERRRLKVMVSIFGRETPVDVEFDQVERNK